MKSTPLGDTVHIEVHGLRRVYNTGVGAFEAVRGIDVVIGAGTIVALLGTNGAGKTSALEVIEGLARACLGLAVRPRGLAHGPTRCQPLDSDTE
jgi:ABC-2 type transport system ATP-binding protein